MKIEWVNVTEIAIGVVIAGVLLIALNGLFGGWVAAQGKEIHGFDLNGKV